jgi:hypothetical protein
LPSPSQVLRLIAKLLPLAHRDEEPAVARKRQPRTVMRIAGPGGLLLKITVNESGRQPLR